MSFDWLLPELSQGKWFLHGLIFLVNIALFFFAKPILDVVDSGRESDSKVKVFRALNVFFLILHVVDILLLATTEYERNFIRLGFTFAAIYASLFFFSVCSYYSRKKFGREKEVNNETLYIDTYSSRLVDVVLLAIIILTTVYVLIKIWGADSMLETTGIFGIIVAFLAFTSNFWAPDIYSGLVILNTQMLDDGDVVIIDGYPDEYIINKVSFIYTTFYDVRNNHRTFIRNAHFLKSKIDNLSRVASTDGIRQSLVFKIGYPDMDIADPTARAEALAAFTSKVNSMFRRAGEAACEDQDIKVNPNKPLEWSLTQVGDYALEYTLFVYLERIPSVKITSIIRKHLMSTLYKVNEQVYMASIVEGLSLSTPVLAAVKLEKDVDARVAL